MIEVIAAHRDGKTIQRRATLDGEIISMANMFLPQEQYDKLKEIGSRPSTLDQIREWREFDFLGFNFSYWEYRVKPEPKEYWIVDCLYSGRSIAESIATPCCDKCKVTHVKEV